MTWRMHLAIVSLLSGLHFAGGMGEPAERRQEPTQTIDCSDGGSNQLEMNVCAERAALAAEARLDRLLGELGGRLEAARWDELDQLQVQWSTFVKDDCAWERGLFTDGSVAPMVYSHCIRDRTKERIARLKMFLCEGRGMTGPCDASRRYDDDARSPI